MTIRATPLQTLLRALEGPDSCFVLGAGVSSPIVPLAAQLGAHVRSRLLAVGSFPANPIPRDAISDRILGPVQTSFDPNDDTFAVQEETEVIATTKEYCIARKLLYAVRRIVLVGYSFGDMDDRVAYGMITSAIKARRLATVVAKPDPYDLAIRIADKSAVPTVLALPVFWDRLAMAILTSIREPRCKTCNHTRL